MDRHRRLSKISGDLDWDFLQQVLAMIDAVKRVPKDFVGLGRTSG
ncbi:hypothetical protein P4S72_12380 [Vibrio sp. PP-XX7]